MAVSRHTRKTGNESRRLGAVNAIFPKRRVCRTFDRLQCPGAVSMLLHGSRRRGRGLPAKIWFDISSVRNIVTVWSNASGT